ncbi:MULTISPECIES: FMN-dependent NADH-azoreductase [Pseudomonadati]|uniref:FMN dependent NADH:quinone oxidoreductase n=1 Tax=Shewanella aestuarii TaxID=1028752 RepID=A0ABT0L3J3_9GAMM|nr:FMN-dependent NADH-azoreductase [Shewanella aestuarii]MCL1118244.1 FMN-dependent NADH-azoreductase [Shewanella aestuarii]GGN80163.1 FMN-dependent NADH-azoreductase [Shewanella aestuarii]
MKKILMLKSSILGSHSQSSALLDDLAMLWKDQGAQITTRDLVADPIPLLDGELANGLRGGDALNERQTAALALSDTLVAELKQNDTIVLAAPMYNFMIPTQLKAWIDFIARAGVTFTYTDTGPQGLLSGKKAVIVTSRGGMHKDAGSDHLVPYLTTLLSFIGIKDVEVVYAEGLNMGPENAATAMANAKQALNQLD